jgi:hypothetical protein
MFRSDSHLNISDEDMKMWKEYRRSDFEHEYLGARYVSVKDLVAGPIKADLRVPESELSDAYREKLTEAITRAAGTMGGFADAVEGAKAAMTAMATATSHAGPVTAKELLDKMTEAKKSIAAATSPGPADPTGWKLTSMRVLNKDYPEYVRIRGGDANTQLKQALGAMSYLEAEAADSTGALNREAASRMRDEVLARWDQEEHKNMVAFLKKGGVSEQMRVLGKVSAVVAAVTATLDAHAPKWPFTPAPDEAEQSLNEAIAHLTNPAAGSW